MHIRQNVSLKPYNTFGIDVPASHFLEIRSIETLREALGRKDLPAPFVLSGGSNILLTAPLDALVLYINLRGRDILREDAGEVIIRAMAGENWHELVMWTLQQGLGGIENLALIPGKAGTAPIQNIGAYGVELRDVFEACTAMDMETGALQRFDREQCHFGYRDSFFKRSGKGRFIIVSLELRLTKNNHRRSTAYGAIESELKARGVSDPSPEDIAEVVIDIRRRKLPDPSQLGNSGSFFKNPVIPASLFEKLRDRRPDIPGYPQADHTVKVPAGWLIEQCGLKGYRSGDAGVHKKQALVLVNYGTARGEDLLRLARYIQKKVKGEFSIDLQPEVNII
ncbi:MAG: UDP-N-acetylmuramate dehydrogenase [Robiginitalea sp.]|jgi:UDP-N-acetylmuramate dehydrogenase